MKKVVTTLVPVIICLMFAMAPILAMASDSDISFSAEGQSFTGQVMTLSEDTNAYAEPNETSDVIHKFSAGESVFVTDDSNGWFQIFYQGDTLFIPNSSISHESEVEAREQAEELAEDIEGELENIDKRATLEMEALERQARSQRNALIWKIVIAVLIVAIIAVSVVIGLKNKKGDEKKEEEKKE